MREVCLPFPIIGRKHTFYRLTLTLLDMYVARPYNFNISPLLVHGERLDIRRDFTFQSGAVQFLIKHSFDMGAVFTKGIPYISREEESVARVNYEKKQEMANSIPDVVISPDDEEAVAFYTKARKTIFDFANQKKVCTHDDKFRW
jgi:poly(A)-specific ribonuclease